MGVRTKMTRVVYDMWVKIIETIWDSKFCSPSTLGKGQIGIGVPIKKLEQDLGKFGSWKTRLSFSKASRMIDGFQWFCKYMVLRSC